MKIASPAFAENAKIPKLRQTWRQPTPATRNQRRASKYQKPGDHLPRPRCAWVRWILPLDGLECDGRNY